MSLKECKERLNTFIESFKHLPDQGSKEWLAGRRYTIGGSEIGTLNGTNYYGKGNKGISSLIAQKLGLNPFNKNTWMRMGNLYEDVVRKYTELIFKTNIEETGCIPGRKNAEGEVIQTFSPDGLGVVETKRLVEYFSAYLDVEEYLKNIGEYCISLFEFKAPGARFPKDHWEDKTLGYHSQILDGLDTIPIVSFGIYVDVVIRRCSLYNLGSNPIWNSGTKYQKIKDLGNPMYCGFVGIYSEKSKSRDYVEEDIDLQKYIDNLCKFRPHSADFRQWLSAAQKGADYFKAPDTVLKDFGDCSVREFENMLMDLIDNKKWKMYHSNLYHNDDIVSLLDELDDFESNHIAIGIVPWKMFHAEIIPVIPQPGFVDNLMPKIEEVIENIKHIANSEAPEEELRIFYPEAPIYKKIKSPEYNEDLLDMLNNL